MSIDLSKPVTTDGALKLTQAEYDYLNSFLAVKEVWHPCQKIVASNNVVCLKL